MANYNDFEDVLFKWNWTGKGIRIGPDGRMK